VIPGFGFTGIAGFFFMITALFITLLDRPLSSPHFWVTIDWSVVFQAAFVTLFAVISGLVFMLFLPLLLPALFQTKAGTWFMLVDSEEREKGYQSAQDGLEQFLGKTGTAKSTLRPAGIATIDGVRMDVVSQGGFIPAKSEVEVVKVEGRRIVVKQR
jgi:membrane-bound ClpP family serine protease